MNTLAHRRQYRNCRLFVLNLREREELAMEQIPHCVVTLTVSFAAWMPMPQFCNKVSVKRDVKRLKKYLEDIEWNRRGFGQPQVESKEFRGQLEPTETRAERLNADHQDKPKDQESARNRDASEEHMSQSPGDAAEGWNLVQSKKTRKERMKEHTTQGSQESGRLFEARGLTHRV